MSFFWKLVGETQIPKPPEATKKSVLAMETISGYILKCVPHIGSYFLLNISLCFMANKNIKIKDATSLNWVSAFEIARIHYFYYCELILVFKN